MVEACASACAAIWAHYDPREAWEAANDLHGALSSLTGQVAAFRGHYLVGLQDRFHWNVQQVADHVGISRARASQLIKAARGKGNPVTDPTTIPVQPPVCLAIITAEDEVLTFHRRDKVPPWTFPGGDMQPGESPHAAAVRLVHKESGLDVTSTQYIGQRVHDLVTRHIIYVHADVAPGGAVHLGDPDDHDEWRWMGIDETRQLMPTMFNPVRQFLDQLQQASQMG
jgi:8-oxo-dGTP diphosphatase